MDFRWFLLLILLSLAFSPSIEAASKKKKKINYDDLEKEWEKGDDESELEHEYDMQRKVSEKKNKFNFDDPKKVAKAMKKNPFAFQGASGGKMAFVELTEQNNAKNRPWDKKDIDELASVWTALIKSASLSASVYNIGDNKILLSCEKGWMFPDVMKFALTRAEVVKVTLDNKDYFPKDVKDDDDDL